jgi:ribosomal protein S6E (S10)
LIVSNGNTTGNTFNNGNTFSDFYINGNNVDIQIHDVIAGGGKVAANKFINGYIEQTNSTYIMLNLTNAFYEQFIGCTFDSAAAGSGQMSLDVNSSYNQFIGSTIDTTWIDNGTQNTWMMKGYLQPELYSKSEFEFEMPAVFTGTGNNSSTYAMEIRDNDEENILEVRNDKRIRIPEDLVIDDNLTITSPLNFPCGDYIDQQFNGVFDFIGISGDDDTDLRVKVNGTYPVISSITDNTVGIDDNLSITSNVSIGLTNPKAKLDIRGGGTQTGFMLRLADSTPTDRVVVLDNGNVGIGNTAPAGLLHVGSQSVPPLFVDSSTGNVGIGLTVPVAKLEVKGASSSTGFTLKLQNQTGTDNVAVLDKGWVGIGVTAPVGLLSVGSSISTPGLFVNATGNGVGIGLTNPLFRLDMKEILRITGASNPYLRIDNTAGGKTWYLQAYTGIIALGTAIGNSMVVDGLGNIGIGTTAPTSKLQVNGTVELSNNITFTGNQPRKSIFLSAGSAITPTTAYAELQDFAGTNFQYRVLAFDTTTSEKAYWAFPIPDNFASANVTATYYWTADTGVTGANVTWEMDTGGFANDEAWKTGALGGTAVNTTDVWLANGDLHAITSANITCDWVAGDYGVVYVSRTTSLDNLSSDVYLLGIKLEYPISALGE